METTRTQSDQHIYKMPWQTTSKSNSTRCKKIIQHNSVGCMLGIQGWFDSISTKWRIKMFSISSIDVEKAVYKILYPFIVVCMFLANHIYNVTLFCDSITQEAR